MKILIVHGISHIEEDPSWQDSLKGPVLQALKQIDPTVELEFQFFEYDHMFADRRLDGAMYAKALSKLSASLAWHGIIDLFHRPRGIFDSLGDKLRWTAGMVAQWSVDLDLRIALQQKLAREILDFDPEVIVAHSMGSLITYDLFTEKSVALDGKTYDGEEFVKDRIYVTLGCQIQNAAVREIFGGYLRHLDSARYWYNLYNDQDTVMVVNMTLQYPGFTQVPTSFDNHDLMNHAWERYILHPAAIEQVWRSIVIPSVGIRTFAGEMSQKTAQKKGISMVNTIRRTPKQRALLIGINDYPDPRKQLEGCVNDVFEMSATLQECGFAAEDIRVVLNARATASGIRERLQWLLDGIDSEDERVLFYSGHGARIPTYGADGKVESYYETLVPYDFDYSAERSLTDADLMELYSNLPYDANFMMVFDCCHSGGMARDGGPKIKALTPPDDIRHRMLRWDVDRQMWTERRLDPILKDVPHNDEEGFIGASKSVFRIGRGAAFRSDTKVEFDAAKKAKGTEGPYLPTIITACHDQEYSFEYRHGVTSFGAFTYALTHRLRRMRDGGKNPTFKKLVSDTAALLKELKYDQTPDLVAPTVVLNSEIPWMAKKSQRKRSRKGPSAVSVPPQK